MDLHLPASWKRRLAPEFEKPYFLKLRDFLEAEREKYTVYPPEKDVFNAPRLTPYDDVNVQRFVASFSLVTHGA